MKATDKNKNIHTIPRGTWEGGTTVDKKELSRRQHLNDITTDLQGNGYPVIQEDQDD